MRADDELLGRDEHSPDDEREVPLEDAEPLVPSTIDPDERIEVADDDIEATSGDGPRDV
jgi:hypothetical protein